MTTSEREMVRELHPKPEGDKMLSEERFTSLQPTYEDTIPPDPEHDWELDD